MQNWWEKLSPCHPLRTPNWAHNIGSSEKLLQPKMDDGLWMLPELGDLIFLSVLSTTIGSLWSNRCCCCEAYAIFKWVGVALRQSLENYLITVKNGGNIPPDNFPYKWTWSRIQSSYVETYISCVLVTPHNLRIKEYCFLIDWFIDWLTSCAYN